MTISKNINHKQSQIFILYIYLIGMETKERESESGQEIIVNISENSLLPAG